MSIYPEDTLPCSDLDNFRSQWLQELQHNVRLASIDSTNDSEQKTLLARSLYQIGISEERAGNPFKAVNFYAKACRLCPDIEDEFKAYHDSPDRSVGSSIIHTPAFLSDDEDDDADTAPCISASLSGLNTKIEGLSLEQDHSASTGWLCEPDAITSTTHISSLPFQVITHILRLVVYPEFDFRSLEECALVSRGFYSCVRSTDLYRIACLRVWGDSIPASYEGLDWRTIYIQRPRVNFHGIYISKIQYHRQGERIFDSSSDIFVTVEYFRYLRFFHDGTALMYTSPEDPKLVVPKLKYSGCRLSGIKFGHYVLHGDKVKILLSDLPVEHPIHSRIHRRAIVAQKDYHNSFYLTLAISGLGKKPSCKLSWMKYSAMNSVAIKGVVQTKGVPTEFNINTNQFKPFFFSRVKSYTLSDSD